MRSTAEFHRASTAIATPHIGPPARQNQRSALDVHGAVVVEDRANGGARSAALGKSAKVGHSQCGPGTPASAGAGDDMQAAARGLVVECRATRYRQASRARIAQP